jgi:hypothetical protein
MNATTRTLLLLVISMLLAPLTACALSGQALEGQVLEAATKKPLLDSLVVARWQGTYSAIAETKTVCYHVETATTDVEGRYRTPAWSAKSKGPFFSPETVIITAYKLGYQSTRVQRTKGVTYLQPFAGTREERFKYLERVFGASGCGTNDGSDKNSIPFMRALYDEAKSIAQTQEEKRMLEFFLYAIEKLEIGFEQAEKRHLERVGK